MDWGLGSRPLDPLNIPNFNKGNRGFLHEKHLEELKFHVANITDYNDNEETLVDHINEESSETFLDRMKTFYKFNRESEIEKLF